MFKIFQLIQPAPLSVRVHSTKCCTYLSRVMRYLGWLPPKEGTKRYLYLFWACLIFACSNLYVPIGSTLSMFINYDKFSSEEFIGVIEVAFDTVGAAIRAIIAIIFLSRYHQTKDLLDKLDERLQNDSDKVKIHKAVARCNYIFLIYGIFYLLYWMSAIMAGVFNGQPAFLVYNPFFNWQDNSLNFWMQSILEDTAMFMVASSTLSVDTNLLIFLTIFRAHIDVLKDHIRNLRTNPLKTEDENYKELMGYITDHKLILQCCNFMRPVFSSTMLIQFLLIGIVLGMNLINIGLFTDIYQAIAALVYFTAVLMESFPFCYLCDLLVEDSEDLSNLIAHSNWIGAEPKYKFTLKIFMHHVQQPIVFIAGGIFPITMTTNITMAKFAFSVMTIMQEMDLV